MHTERFSDLDLTPLMDPKVIGIVGASQRKSRGTRVLENLLSIGFDGPVYPINPRYDDIQGVRCYPSVDAVPETIDSLVVAIPGSSVPELLVNAREAGTRAAVVLSSGFREAGPEGLNRHEQLEALARSGMPICGPNCYGILNLASRAATFSGFVPDPPRPGSLALVSQSGGFTNQIANPLIEDRGLGFKYMVSCGNQAGARVEDYLAYLVADPDIRAIGCFVEGLSSVDRLLEVGQRAAADGKAIVMLKAGRSHVARAAVASHTGSIAGSAEVADAVLEKAGIISASTLDELAEILSLLALRDSRRIGRRVLVVSGSGGEGAHAADAAEQAGLLLPELSENSATRLSNHVLPEFGNAANPLDGTGAMFEDPQLFPGLIEVAATDDNVDLVAVNLNQRPPNGPFTPHRRFAAAIGELSEAARQRIVGYGSMAVGPLDEVLISSLRDASVPFLAGTDLAMRAIAKVAQRNERLATGVSHVKVSSLEASNDWPHVDSLEVTGLWGLLKSYSIPVVPLEVAVDADEAVSIARAMGYPVALKVASLLIGHKSDIGGVALNLTSADQVAAAYGRISTAARQLVEEPEARGVIVQAMAMDGVELLLGVVRDDTLGPAVVVGTGGVFTELMADARVMIPPLGVREARQMIEGLKGFPLLTGTRGGQPADVRAAAEVLSAVSNLAADLPGWVRAIDLNPIIVHAEGDGASCVDVWIETETPANREN